jgi:hypothetical protein
MASMLERVALSILLIEVAGRVHPDCHAHITAGVEHA